MPKPKKTFMVTLFVETDKATPDLHEMIAQRAYAIDGVTGVDCKGVYEVTTPNPQPVGCPALD